MKNRSTSIVTNDPWSGLSAFTDARIGLGRVGSSIPVQESLKFKLAHAQARDAVHQPFDQETLQRELAAAKIPCQTLTSAVSSRSEYLTRPDKGRKLSGHSRESLAAAIAENPAQCADKDICLVVCDGLSTRAIHENCAPFIKAFWPLAKAAQYSLAPVQVVSNGRVAIGDEIGETLQARMTVVLIGERPGLSSPNSLGIYMTYRPRIGATDEARNCISNVRPKGLSIQAGVQKLAYLIECAFSEQRSGVLLKDKMRSDYLPFGQRLQIGDAE